MMIKNIKRNIYNNFLLVKIAFQASPFRVISEFVMGIVQNLFNVFYVAVFFRNTVNYVEQGDYARLVRFLIFSCFVFMIEVFVRNIYNGFIRSQYDQILIEAFNFDIFNKCKSLDLSCFDNLDFYKKMSKATADSDNYIIQALSNISNFITSIIGGSALVSIIVNIDRAFLLFIVIPVVARLLIGNKLNKVRYALKMENNEEQRRKSYIRNVMYSLEYAKEMRFYNIFPVLKSHFLQASDAIIRNVKKQSLRISSLHFFYNIFTSPTMFLGATFYAAYLYIVKASIPIGDVVVIGISVSSTIGLIFKIIDSLLSFSYISLYVENLREFLDYTPKIEESQQGELPEHKIRQIAVNDIAFSYDNMQGKVLERIRFQVGEKEKIALVGNNGAGKSTLISLLTRLYDCKQGSIEVNGKNIQKYNVKSYRALFNVVCQEFKLYSLSIKDNILLSASRQVSDDEIWKALDKVGMSEKVKTLEHGIDTIMTKEFDPNGAILSGGEMQKIAIARIFVNDAPIVILDEPTSSMDALSESEIIKNIFEYCKDKILIYVSHNVFNAALADRILVLADGKIENSGTHEELVAYDNLYSNMYHESVLKYEKQMGRIV